MNRFYLNECLGGTFSCIELAEALQKTVRAFMLLSKKDNLHINKGWVLEKEADKVTLGGNKLQDIVNNFPSREVKRLFYSYTLHYPIASFFAEIDECELLQADYTFEGKDAINMVIVGKSGGLLLTPPVSDAVRQDDLDAESSKPGFGTIQIPNLHGDTRINIDSIEKKLLRKNYEQAPCNLSKLMYLAPCVKMSDVFCKRFEEAHPEHVKSIFARLDEVLENNLLQPLRCNSTMIKSVAEHVYELRIVNPVDIRIYFHEDKNTLYFAKMALKSEYVAMNAQTKDIEDSEKIILQLMGNN